MSTYLTDMKADIRGILKDDPSSTADYQLSDTELGTIISEQALLRFSFDHPYVKRKFYVGTGEYDYALPSDWSDSFSRIASIEYDIDSQAPDIQEGKDWILYESDDTEYSLSGTASGTSVTCTTVSQALFFHDGNLIKIGAGTASENTYVTADGVSATGVVAVEALSGTYSSSPYIKRVKCFRFLYQSPETTETFMMEYTTLHTLTESTITIDTAWRAAFKYLCAVVCSEHLSHKYGYWSDSSMGADIVDYSAKADYWRSRAKDLIVVYKSFSGEEKDVVPASAKGEYDISLPWGTDHVFHPRKWR